MTNIRLKLSPPWVTYINKLQALFDPDPLIAFNVNLNGETGPSVVLATNDGDKAAALVKLLPAEKKFGNITLSIGVDCNTMSNRAFVTKTELFETAFKGNPAFAYAICPVEEGYNFFAATYVVFKNCVVQFFNDNLNDCHGVVSTLYEDIAEEIFEDAGLEGVYYNTDIEVGALGKPLGKPLGEWP